MSLENADIFGGLKAAVFARRPVLGKILERHGRESLLEYSRSYYCQYQEPNPRQAELIEAIAGEAGRLLGPAVAASVAAQLRRYYVVSTTDHHGPLVSPFFLSSNLLSAAPHMSLPGPDMGNVIVLAFGSVSVENSSFPRGLLFNSSVSDEVQKLPFYSKNHRPALVSHLPAYHAKDLEKVRSLLQSKAAKGEISAAEADQVAGLLDEVYATPEAYASHNFCEQITKTNFKLWPKFFPAGANPPSLVYLEVENIVNRLLHDHHLSSPTLIHRLMFDEGHRQLLQVFEGIEGIYSCQGKYGTFLFWGIPHGVKYRLPMWEKDGYIVAEDDSFRVALEPEAIAAALKKKEIVPSMLLVFLLLTGYYGIKCQGGFSQVNYLTEIKAAYLELMAKLGDRDSAAIAMAAKTDELCGEVTVAYLRKADGSLVPATGVDLAIRSGPDTWPVFLEQCRALTLAESLDPVMPEFYRILYGDQAKEEKYPGLEAADVRKAEGLDEKIKPCVRL